MELSSLRYSTEHLPARDRFAYWRDAICAVFVKLDAQPVAGAPFNGSIDVQEWSALRLSHVTAGGQLVTRLRGEDAGDCLLSLQLHGTGAVRQAGREAVLQPGDMALYDATSPYELEFAAQFQQVVVQFPRQEMLDRGIVVERRVARRNPSSDAMTAVTATLIEAMRRSAPGLDLLDRERLSLQALDCIAAVLDPARDRGTAWVEPVGARRTAVLAYVARHADSPDLTVERVAAHFATTPRSLQRLFADDVIGLADRIRWLRMRRATTQLLARPGLTIAQVAAENGYSDAAHFARAFRAHHHCTPTEFRDAQATIADHPPA